MGIATRETAKEAPGSIRRMREAFQREAGNRVKVTGNKTYFDGLSVGAGEEIRDTA